MAHEEIEGARAAIADAATLLAEEIATAPAELAGEIRGRADALNVVALAVSQVAWGPYGGQRHDNTRHQATYDYGKADKPPAGFGHPED